MTDLCRTPISSYIHTDILWTYENAYMFKYSNKYKYRYTYKSKYMQFVKRSSRRAAMIPSARPSC